MQLTVIDLQKKKEKKEKIVALTAYDASFASLIDEKVDIVLVGDSLGMVIQGQKNTLAVSIDDMIYHTKAVASSVMKSHLTTDMPFLSYQISKEEALRNAGLLLKAGAQSIKLEGGEIVCETVRHLTRFGIPVMGHIGLTPQSIHQLGGFRVQGREEEKKDQLLREANLLQEAGAFSLVLESVPQDLAKIITSHLKIPTIGIGAGIYCDGQILVIYDLLGIDARFHPKFVKRYADLSSVIQSAVEHYARDVREEKFPSIQETFH